VDEAARHPHNVHRGTFIEPDGVLQAAPAPRFSRTSPGTPTAPAVPGQHTREVLLEAGFSAEQVDALQAAGAAR
jgi:alpha-methylacyl-CoA racemase